MRYVCLLGHGRGFLSDKNGTFTRLHKILPSKRRRRPGRLSSLEPGASPWRCFQRGVASSFALALETFGLSPEAFASLCPSSRRCAPSIVPTPRRRGGARRSPPMSVSACREAEPTVSQILQGSALSVATTRPVRSHRVDDGYERSVENRQGQPIGGLRSEPFRSERGAYIEALLSGKEMGGENHSTSTPRSESSLPVHDATADGNPETFTVREGVAAMRGGFERSAEAETWGQTGARAPPPSRERTRFSRSIVSSVVRNPGNGGFPASSQLVVRDGWPDQVHHAAGDSATVYPRSDPSFTRTAVASVMS